MLSREDLIQLENLVEKEIEFQRKLSRDVPYNNAQVLIENRRKNKIIKLERLRVKLNDLINEKENIRPEGSI